MMNINRLTFAYRQKKKRQNRKKYPQSVRHLIPIEFPMEHLPENCKCTMIPIYSNKEDRPISIIFLDIDGVLNTYYQMVDDPEDQADCRWPEEPYVTLSRKKISFLNQIIEQTGAKIVLSSSWRSHYKTIQECDDYFKKKGFKGDIIGMTPHTSLYGVRGNEIRQWIHEHTQLLGIEQYYGDRFKRYIILDDEDDMLLWQKNHLIQLHGNVGLTMNDVKMACYLLNVEFAV